MSANEHSRLFIQRLESMKAAALTHPWAQWVAVVDPSSVQACLVLNGKAWRVDSSELDAIIREHLNAQHPSCRCRLQPKRK